MYATRNEHQDVTLARFIKAAKNKRPITIDYVDESGEHTVRTIEPYDVDVERGFVRAMCRKRGTFRTFRFERVTHYTVHSGTFQLTPPEPADPNEIVNWWAIVSRTGVEILQVELNTDGTSNPYARVLAKAMAESPKVRAVSRAERGVSIRRLRRRDVIAYQQ